MPRSFLDQVLQQPVIDVHEHHMPHILLRRDVDLLALLQESYASWSIGTAHSPRPAQPRWDDIAQYVEAAANNAFVRNMIGALSSLYDLGDEGITRDNWQHLDRLIQQRHAEPNWVNQVLERAGIRQVITDPFMCPMLNATEEIGACYRSVLRINALLTGWRPDAADHNGNGPADFARLVGCRIESFEDHLRLVEKLLDAMPERNQVGIKCASAYDRTLDFNDVDERVARRTWGSTAPTPLQMKAFGDVVFDHLCRLAGERDIPVQIHLGLARIRGSHPMNVAGLIERHPRTRFLLMHLGYPWGSDVMGLAFTYPNVWIDLTWSWLISPSFFQRMFHEAIEVLRDESRMMLGGDNRHIEETYGAITWGRRLIAQVLEEKVQAGYFTAQDALRLARKIMHDNAAAFFKLPVLNFVGV